MTRTIVLALAALAVASGCRDCDVTPVTPEFDVVQIDVFEQKQAAKVDILWMSDNSPTMQAEQDKLAERFNQFFGQLLLSQVDYHIGVITQDRADLGKLRAYSGPNVDGCTNCRFLDATVPCANPDVSIEGLTTEAEIEAKLGDECPAQLVFRKLIRTGLGDAVFEEAFVQAAQALGVQDVDPATGVPAHNPPTENTGFIRDDASLYVIFVSDEDESAKNDGTPVRYYQRLFESLKGPGNENKVAIAAITGWPIGQTDIPPLGEVCDILATTFDSNLANDDARAGAVLAQRLNPTNGCVDQEAERPEGNDFAESGGRYIELACRTGGVVANMCEADYSAALDALGANAAGLLRKFTLSKNQTEIQWGNDCVPLTEDDPFIDCDDDGVFDGPNDGVLCVKAQGLDDDAPRFIPADPNTGWFFEVPTNSVRFGGSFLPKPGTTVEVSYETRVRACGSP